MTASAFDQFDFVDSWFPWVHDWSLLGGNFWLRVRDMLIPQALSEDLNLFGERVSMDAVDRLDVFEYLDTIQREICQTNNQDDLISYFHSFLDAICSGHNRSFGQEWFKSFFYTDHPVAWKQSFTEFMYKCRSVTWPNHEVFNELVMDFCGLLNIAYITPLERPLTSTILH